MTDLRTIEVEVEELDDSAHAVITLRGVVAQLLDDGEVPAEVATSQLWAANIDVAGIVARVACYAAPFAVESALHHHCLRVDWPGREAMQHPLIDGCGVSVGREAILPGEDTGASVMAEIAVPLGDVDIWLQRVQIWLSFIIHDAEQLEELRANERTTSAARPSNVVDIGQGIPAPHDPGGGCEHMANGLDRMHITGVLRCQICRRDEASRARAREIPR